MKKSIRLMAVAMMIALLCALFAGAQAERMAVSNGLRLNIKPRPSEETAEADKTEEKAESKAGETEEKAESKAEETEKAVEEKADEIAEEAAAEEEDERSAMVIDSDDDSQVTLYAAASTDAEILGSIPAGAMLGARKISGEWSLVSYNGMIGYVHTSGIALFNADAKEEEKVRSIRIVNSLDGAGAIKEGTIMTLTAKLSGFEDDSYTFQWSESEDGESFHEMPGETGSSVSLPLTRNNINHLWHVTVTLTDKAA